MRKARRYGTALVGLTVVEHGIGRIDVDGLFIEAYL
jgi:hypothetical protein